ncbi:MAG: ParB/RepB/Spo0J family partition protein, partial [Oscillospiraceae bacterium]|nr:ParB/RepB/Spo0J family partition protein [Oscillospiraceae bacterium]
MQLVKKQGLYESRKVVFIDCGSIAPNPSQPRRRFDPKSLAELSESISRYGVLQPLTVRRAQNGGYELISGERRLRASRIAGLSQVPCIVMDVDDEESSLIALVENLQRKDLDFIEEAEGLFRLLRDHSMSQEEAARRIGKSQSAVANKLRLLRLSPETLYLIRENGLSERHARALLRLEGEEDRLKVLSVIIKRSLSVSASEKYIDDYIAEKEKAPQSEKNCGRQTIVMRDVRLFLNTVSRGAEVMKRSGVDVLCRRSDTDSDIILTITIPKAPAGITAPGRAAQE